MKIIITGSLGNVSKPLTEQLVKQGHDVIVISRDPKKQKTIEAMGAGPVIGSMEDLGFLTTAFEGADAVYCMIAPPGSDLSNHGIGTDTILKQADTVANHYLKAIQRSSIKHVVYLSSVGAYTDKENGLIALHARAENTLKKLPPDISVTFLRPVGFYTVLLNFIYAIKAKGIIASVYGEDDMVSWVSPIDIARAAVEELNSSAPGLKIRYVASDELSCNEAAGILGEAIGMPDLKWVIINSEQALNRMEAAGLNPSLAESFVEMNASIHSGLIYKDYYQNKPVLGKVKLKDFAKEFAAAYHQK
ncbi:SDR family oxidoreductase [Pedobacter sp. L105]|uniref:SDR family oxidoreductase n=1 Tax=Pedobacter sp. L105 TaxID=1641871 RepID=UPI00131CE731|nr:NAD(P)H-binding protein [Pedobacter sp. L105]